MGLRKLKVERSKKLRRMDVHGTTSKRGGFEGVMEGFIRRFRTLGFLVFLSPLVAVGCMTMGLAAAPGIFVYEFASQISMGWPAIFRYMALGCGFAAGYLTYGISLLFLVPLVNFLMPFRVKPFRGPWYSLPAIPWYVHNAFTYMVRYTFLEFVTPSPLNILFYRMMGMKIGKGVVINSTNISDPCLITLGDYVTVGGSATIFGHYGQKGFLIIAPVKVGKGTNIGLKASLMGGVTVGEDVTIKPHTVLLPKTNVGDGEIV